MTVMRVVEGRVRTALAASWMSSAAVGASMVLAIAACGVGDAPSGSGWVGTIDTLPNGAVRVRNLGQGFWAPGDAWRLVEELRLGSVDGEVAQGFGTVSDIATDADGRMYVLDGMSFELRAFDRGGAHLWSAGREGQGPGEFSGPVAVTVGPDALIWVVDRRNQRYSAFDREGALVREVRRGRGGPFANWRGRFDSQGRLVDPSLVPIAENRLTGGVARTDTALQLSEVMVPPRIEGPRLGEIRMGRATLSFPVPFMPELTWTVSPGGDIWLGLTDPYSMALTTFEGDTLRIIERSASRLPLDDADRESLNETLTELREANSSVDLSQIPDDKPRLRWLEAAPDGHIWARVFTGDPAAPHGYDIFDPEGRLLGTVSSPLDLEEGLAFGKGSVLGVVRDDLDIPWVVRFRIE